MEKINENICGKLISDQFDNKLFFIFSKFFLDFGKFEKISKNLFFHVKKVKSRISRLDFTFFQNVIIIESCVLKSYRYILELKIFILFLKKIMNLFYFLSTKKNNPFIARTWFFQKQRNFGDKISTSSNSSWKKSRPAAPID